MTAQAIEDMAIAIFLAKNGPKSKWDTFPERYKEGYRGMALAAWATAPADLAAVLRAYEQWEADLIMSNAVWIGDLPRMTQDLYNRFIEIQAKRNEALACVPVAVEQKSEPQPLPEGYELFDGKPMKVINGDRSGWWRFHNHYDRDGYCDNPGRGY